MRLKTEGQGPGGVLLERRLQLGYRFQKELAKQSMRYPEPHRISPQWLSNIENDTDGSKISTSDPRKLRTLMELLKMSPREFYEVTGILVPVNESEFDALGAGEARELWVGTDLNPAARVARVPRLPLEGKQQALMVTQGTLLPSELMWVRPGMVVVLGERSSGTLSAGWARTPAGQMLALYRAGADPRSPLVHPGGQAVAFVDQLVPTDPPHVAGLLFDVGEGGGHGG